MLIWAHPLHVILSQHSPYYRVGSLVSRGLDVHYFLPSKRIAHKNLLFLVFHRRFGEWRKNRIDIELDAAHRIEIERNTAVTGNRVAAEPAAVEIKKGQPVKQTVPLKMP